MPDIYKKIIALRKKRGLSQSQTAELSNIPTRTYQRIESGHTSASVDYLNRIASGLNCSMNDILYFDLETNDFQIGKEISLKQKNEVLEEENGRLRQFVNWLTEQLRGGGEKRNSSSLFIRLC